MNRNIAVLLLILVLLLSSCSQELLQVTPTIKTTGVITPYRTRTPSPIIPTSTALVTIPVTPAPTATPFTHTVVKGETMLGIAFQYGISLEDLKAANPTVDPRFLTIGTGLIIPISGEIPQFLPTPTPAQLDLDQPQCYRSGEGGAYCIIVVHNTLDAGVENISAWIGLFSSQGVNIASQTAYSSLDLVQADNTIPMMVYFEPPIPDDYHMQSQLLTALEVIADDPRYLPSHASIDQVVISQDGSQAQVIGKVIVDDNKTTASQIKLLVVGYDRDGSIVGLRNWESSGEIQFDLTVFSLSGAIDHVTALTEARP